MKWSLVTVATMRARLLCKINYQFFVPFPLPLFLPSLTFPYYRMKMKQLEVPFVE